MARGRKKPTIKTDKRARELRQQRQAEQELAAAVQDTAARFTCTTEVARDFADQCEQRIDDSEFDLACSNLALEIWSSPSEAARPVVDLLRELAEERKRHLAALARIGGRLDELADRDIHEHLEPVAHYEELVKLRLFEPDPEPGPEQRTH